MFPKNDPKIKLEPAINPIGRLTVCNTIKSIDFFSWLFCIPINKTINKAKLKKSE